MTTDYAKLVKILRAEQKDGCRDRVVVGGFEKFLAVWSHEAESTNREGSVAKVRAHLNNYAQKPVAERTIAVRKTLILLGAAEQEPVQEKQRIGKGADLRKIRGRIRQSGPSLRSPVTAIRGVSSVQGGRLTRLGANTVEDMLYLFPRRYDDFSRLRTISNLHYGEEATVVGVVRDVRNQQTRRGIHLTKAVISDGTGSLEAAWFNQRYLARRLVPGRRIVLSGQVDQYLGRPTFKSPEWEPWSDKLIHTGRLVPVYPLTEGLSARRMRNLMKTALEQCAGQLADGLPPSMRQDYGLVDLGVAVRQMHFPDSKESLERARYRLCFEEFLLIQLGVAKQRLEWQRWPGRPMSVDQQMLGAFVDALPFTLTRAQQRALREITDDLQRSHPMSRLLQGDVGSGKTIVALVAMLAAVMNGMQAVMMAPTEVLAKQHNQTLTTLLRQVADTLADRDGATTRLVSQTRVGLLVGSLSQAEKEAQHQRIAAGEIDIVVGTHALIQEGVAFKDLALAVIDEQHRFGVSQRSALRQKGHNPHILVMSATPIPRTLALTVYGDLDISVIDELPPNRQKIVTKWLAPLERERAYSFVRGQVTKGRQAFIVCPLVEESARIEAKAAVSEHQRLQSTVFPDLRLGLLHGRMKSEDKERVMEHFRTGGYDILVATPVVEVGIDVPNATVMLVEGADRFGLAQLHQFRGRVGRGENQSYCLLLADSPTYEGEQRLRIIEATHDGFLLAEEDLKMRGPGEFFGTRQSGLPELKVAGLGDIAVLEQARKAALDLIQEDPSLSRREHQLLAQKVREFWRMETDLS